VKTTGKCPKCGGTDLIVIPPITIYGNVISGRTIFTIIRCARYVCGACGFIEEYVEDQADIETLKRRYAK
jgi:hypothetical protein